MNEDEADDLFASIKLLLDEVVATSEKRDRRVKAGALLRTLEQALYDTKKCRTNRRRRRHPILGAAPVADGIHAAAQS